MIANEALRPFLDRLQRLSLGVGVGGLVLSLLGAWINPRQFYQSYLVAYLFWIGIALGCIGIVMLHHLVGGTWGFVIRRLLESGATTLWLMALLFVPFLFGMRELYLWARPDIVSHDEVLAQKSIYLNVNFFLVRTGAYFAVWMALSFFLTRWSRQQDRTGDPRLVLRLQRLSAAGLVVLFLTASFAAIDWVMSLEPDWYSTIYGAMVVTGQALATLAFATAAAAWLSHYEPLAQIASPARFQDLGNLLLAFVMLWAYMSFSQFLIVWCGNLTEEIPWYLRRTRGGWQWLGLALIVFQFFLPFLVLLLRDIKRQGRALLVVAGLILAMHFLATFWLVAPAPVFQRPRIGFHWIDIVTPVGIGGVWLAAFLWQLKNNSLVPLRDPRLLEALEKAKGA
ncbi:MAG TPA: hypothetical protein VGZ22_03250 [Isosphaeraceae bacterium]|jgi:hypothetical protein|nr:hypothetical protein [Isosphaeraceae bacterium]